MKKIIFLFLMFGLSLFAKEVNRFATIDTFKANITETTNLNNKMRVTKYQITAKLPDELKKTMIFPDINKGEIYLYKGASKVIYYPVLEQIIESTVDENENYILKFIRDLKYYDENNLNNEFQLISINGYIEKINYNDGITIIFEKFLKINGINFPSYVKILDGKNIISTLVLEDIHINPSILEEELSIDEIIKN